MTRLIARIFLPALLLIPQAMQVGRADSGQTAALERQIAPLFAAWDRKDSPGMSVAVMQHGKVIYSRGFGSAQLEYAAPITPATIFNVASVSKQFTAMSILLLEAEGRLSFDDEVQKYLPWVPRFAYPITLRQLANHTSGVRDHQQLFTLAGWWSGDVVTMDDIRTLVKHQRELNFPPLTDTLYSNTGYDLLADVVTAVSGMPFEQFTQERIFKPLGMSHSHFHTSHKELVPGRAYSYTPAGHGQWRKAVMNDSYYGSTGLFTTAEDMLLWLDNFRTLKVGGREVIARLLQAPVLSNGKPSIIFGAPYAAGVSLNQYRGTRMIGQGGVEAGFRAEIDWFPEHDLAIAVLANAANGDPQGNLRRIADVVLAGQLQPAPEDPLQRQPVRVATQRLESYAGTYNWYFGTVTFVPDRAQGTLVADISGSKLPLTAVSEREFVVDLGSLKALLRFGPGAGDRANDTAPVETLEVSFAGGTHPGRRLHLVSLTGSDMVRYVGSYYSPELRTSFEIGSGARGLILQHHRQGDIPLLAEKSSGPNPFPVLFAGGPPFAQRIQFETAGDGHIRGLRLSGITVRNLWFQKVTLP